MSLISATRRGHVAPVLTFPLGLRACRRKRSRPSSSFEGFRSYTGEEATSSLFENVRTKWINVTEANVCKDRCSLHDSYKYARWLPCFRSQRWITTFYTRKLPLIVGVKNWHAKLLLKISVCFATRSEHSAHFPAPRKDRAYIKFPMYLEGTLQSAIFRPLRRGTFHFLGGQFCFGKFLSLAVAVIQKLRVAS